MTLDESYDDEVKVTVIATGFKEYEENTVLKRPLRDDFGRRSATKSQDFVARSLEQDANNQAQETEEEKEDYDTPAFLRKRL